MSTRWVIYSTFDTEGMARQHALEQVAAYRANGFNVLVIDTSPTISPERANGWTSHATAWFARENVGYDMKSYQTGFEWLATRRFLESSSVILTNDSCYGPLFPIGGLFEMINNNDARNTVFGITDSYELSYHLQSYFLYFNPDTVSAAYDFFKKLGEVNGREEAITKGEIELSRFLLNRGIALMPICSIHQFANHLSRLAWTTLIGELLIRKLLKRHRYGRYEDNEYLKLLLYKGRKQSWTNLSEVAGAEIVMLKLSPFIKRRLLSEQRYFPNSFRRRCFFRRQGLTIGALTNEAVRTMLVEDGWL